MLLETSMCARKNDLKHKNTGNHATQSFLRLCAHSIHFQHSYELSNNPLSCLIEQACWLSIKLDKEMIKMIMQCIQCSNIARRTLATREHARSLINFKFINASVLLPIFIKVAKHEKL